MTTGDDQRVRTWMAETMAIVDATPLEKWAACGCGKCGQILTEHGCVAAAIGASDEGYSCGEGYDDDTRQAVARHIATFDPPTLRKLLAVVEAAHSIVNNSVTDRVGWVSIARRQAEQLHDALTALTEPTHDD